MDHTQLLRAILPDVLIDNFDVAKFEKTDLRFDIWLDEKKVQMREDKKNSSVISHGFGEYHTIQDFPIRGRATYLHVRKRKWLDKDSGEIFSYEWELSEYDETHLNLLLVKPDVETKVGLLKLGNVKVVYQHIRKDGSKQLGMIHAAKVQLFS